MKRVIDNARAWRGTTIVELTVAVAIMATVFAAIMPLFAGIRNSADSRWASLEMVQNARVLNEQLSRCLAGAKRIVTASARTSDDGYIEFEAADGTVYRCAREAGGIEYGPVGDLQPLAGPVKYLRFACYDGDDLTDPLSDPNSARLIAWEAGLEGPTDSTAGKTVTGACYLRTGLHSTSGSVVRTYDSSVPDALYACSSEGSTQVRTPTLLELLLTGLTSSEYDQLEADDDVRYTHSAILTGDYPLLWLFFTIEENKNDVTRVTATWTGRGLNGSGAYADGARLYLYNWQSSAYELLQASANTTAEVTLTGTRQEVASRFVGGLWNHNVQLLVVTNDKKASGSSNQLFSDYVRVEVGTGTGTSTILP